MASRAFSQRDQVLSEIQETLDRVDMYVAAEDRQQKVESELKRAERLLPVLVTRTEKVVGESEEEEAGKAEECLRVAQEAFDQARDRALTYFGKLVAATVSEPPGAEEPVVDTAAHVAVPTSVPPGTSHRGSNSQSSRSSKGAAQLQLDSLKEENEMADKIAELELRILKDKAHRAQKLRAAQFDVLVASEVEDSQSASVCSAEKVNTWLDGNATGTAPVGTSAHVPASQQQRLVSESGASPHLPGSSTAQLPSGVTPGGRASVTFCDRFSAPVMSTSQASSHRPVSHLPLASYAPPQLSSAEFLARTPAQAAGPSLGPPSSLGRKPNYQRNLPKWKLEDFDGDPLRWPRWSGQFLSTIDSADISVEEKLAFLSQYCTGKASHVVDPLVNSGASYFDVFARLRARFGQAHVVVSAHLDRLSQFPPVRMHNSEQLVDFALAVSGFVNVLQTQGFYEDLNGTTNLAIVVQKLPPNLRESWSRHVIRDKIARPTLLHFNAWLEIEADSHEYMRNTIPPAVPRSKLNEPPKPRAVKTFATVNTEWAKSHSPGDSQKPKVKCPLCSQPHALFKCDQFRSLSATQRAETAKENNQCFSCLNGEHQSRSCPRGFKCGVDGCASTTHNRLLHGAGKVFPRKQSSGNLATANGHSLASPSQVNSHSSSNTAVAHTLVAHTKGLLQIAEVRVRGPLQTLTTFALFDSGSTNSWCDNAFASQLGFTTQSTESLAVVGLHKEDVIRTRRIPLVVSAVSDKHARFQVTSLTKDNFVVGHDRIDLASLKRAFPHLSPLPDAVIDYTSVKLLLGQDAFAGTCPIEVASLDARSPCAVRTPLGWVASGPLPAEFVRSVSSFHASIDFDDGLADQLRTWWDLETYAAARSVDPRAKCDQQAVEILETSTHHDGTRYVVGMLWADPTAELPNNYFAALAQYRSLEKRLEKDMDLRKRYAQSIDDDVAKGYVKKLSQEEIANTRSHARVWYFAPTTQW